MGEVEGVVGEAEVGLETMTTERGITAGVAEEVPVRDIDLLRVLARLPYVAGHLLATALLAPAAPLVALVLAVQFVHAQSLRLLAVDLPHREARLLPHRAVAVAVVAIRHHTRHAIKSGIVGAEDATAVVLPRDVDAPARPHAAVLRVEALTVHVADAVQAPVAVEGIAPSQAHGPRRVGEGVRETGVGVGAGAGMQRMAGARKGCLVGVEAGPGVQVRAGPKKKVGAEHEMLALRTVQLLGSGSKARPRLSGRETGWNLRRTLMSPGILKNFFDVKVSSRRRLCATKSFAHGRGR